ncbi:MAG: transglutaminase family protein, partial [Planctomycetia bacterium]|nr:transglutaminase family protein [Planctomycetia bacterium]
YSEEQWQSIDALGRRIDEQLEAMDVRLTMGGEPTFVSIDDREGPEWNTTALGEGKQKQAGVLLHRLREKFAPGALLVHGQGKWYPGEPLPRWAYSCYWRKDGVPMWEDHSLIADANRNYGYSNEDAHEFISLLAERLGITRDYCIPAYEDAWYHLWREQSLPMNVDPLKSELENPEERKRLAKVFDQGLKKVVGYAMPIRRDSSASGLNWESDRWHLRREYLFLIPGDSPMGYRLPLDSLLWEPLEKRSTVIPMSPFAPREPLPQFRNVAQAGSLPLKKSPPSGKLSSNGTSSKLGSSTIGLGASTESPITGKLATCTTVVRTTLCVEPRDGRLHVFLPPVSTLEDYLELITAIEATAAELQKTVLIEGYKPPSDHRINHFQIMPDPGVIEVNVHPARNWRELVNITSTVYEESRLSRLSAEKFMLDGRHCGTGGGNHIVIGGSTPADSPVLRRPDLLRSLLACWHNHPSLSYLFSSLFVGPTSQAPRLDEARNDSLYELEIAFRQIPDEEGCFPWMVDRTFRHLLTDVTGNTHRAEFCIDKLYSPDSDEGRRGLLELRAFEMPPDSRMSLVQQLLLRALVARFWESPYKHKLARWGTELHDRFMLPHFVEQDFDDLLHEMDDAGYPVQKDWFDVHFEFRFPLLGSVTHRGVHLELRQAIEPWHVLGEEPGPGGTARYVDSSIERVQLKVRGLTDARHIVTCNGFRVPLHPTGTNGEFVAGVRYRAWQPPSCLHPTIKVHAPLIFDVYDTWTGRSIGGCQYHVSHPGGRSFDVFPINAAVAETRRQSRFFPFGHTPNAWKAPPLEINSEFPLTLDLRKTPEAKVVAPLVAVVSASKGSVIVPSSPGHIQVQNLRLPLRAKVDV